MNIDVSEYKAEYQRKLDALARIKAHADELRSEVGESKEACAFAVYDIESQAAQECKSAAAAIRGFYRRSLEKGASVELVSRDATGSCFTRAAVWLDDEG